MQFCTLSNGYDSNDLGLPITPQIIETTPVSTSCIPCISLQWMNVKTKFGVQIDHSKSQPKHDK